LAASVSSFARSAVISAIFIPSICNLGIQQLRDRRTIRNLTTTDGGSPFLAARAARDNPAYVKDILGAPMDRLDTHVFGDLPQPLKLVRLLQLQIATADFVLPVDGERVGERRQRLPVKLDEGV